VPGGTAVGVPQKDSFNAAGTTIRAQYDSLQLDAGAQYESHSRPYAGTPATANPSGAPIPGVPDTTTAKGVVTWGELDYVIWPWFVPGVRAEYTRGTVEASNPIGLLRVIPGIAMLVRPDVRVILTGDFETAYGAPVAGSWAPAGGLSASPAPGQATRFQAETLTATAAVAF
jgi:hypothetical protein